MREPRHRPATADDFHRLAELAHQRGLRLFRDGPRWYCSSASDAGGCHYVTGFSCDCQGFVAHQRCSHHALLLERLGWLPEVEADVHQLTRDERVQRLIDSGQEPGWAAEIVDFELGLIGPDTIGPPLPAPADCPDCTGCGVVVYRTFEERCPACGGSGIKPDHRLQGQPAVMPVAA
jgi:hypothetical protein